MQAKVANHLKHPIRGIVRLAVMAAVAVGGDFGWQWWLAHQPAPLPEGIAFGNGRIEAVQVDIATKYAGRIESVFAQLVVLRIQVAGPPLSPQLFTHTSRSTTTAKRIDDKVSSFA